MSVLKGLKVIEMNAIGPIPLAGMMLADMGADVVIIDRDDDPWKMQNDHLRRGKRAVTLNLKSINEQKDAIGLINKADVVLEGYRPGVMESLGLGPETFFDSNRGLIYGRMTGWGQTGPLAQTAGHDINYIGLTGALFAMGSEESPPPIPLNLVGDYGGGTMFLLVGVLAALYERYQSGQGQVIDAAITEGTANLMAIIHSLSSMGLWNQSRGSNLLDSAAHFYGTYETSDGKFVSVGALEPQFYKALLEGLELDIPEFQDQNNADLWPKLKIKLSQRFKQKTRDEWADIFATSDACVTPILTYKEAPSHPHMDDRKTYFEGEHGIQPAPAPRFSRSKSEASNFRGEVCVKEIDSDWGT